MSRGPGKVSIQSRPVSDSTQGQPVRTVTMFVDGHVHFHDCFTWPRFLDCAAQNIRSSARQLGIADCRIGVLMFTESSGVHHWRSIRANPSLAGLSWSASAGSDGRSVLCDRADSMRLILVVGRQIVTQERLEVLGLGCARSIADGQSLAATIRQVRHNGGVAVVPWGFGKWTLRRGRIVAELIESATETGLALGDNGSRMAIWPRPRLLNHAERCSVLVLPGSDPLPFPEQISRPGSFGFVLHCELSDRPAEDILNALRSLRQSPRAFGWGRPAHRFAMDQVRMQWMKLMRGRRP